MGYKQESFYIYLPSSASLDVYPENTLAHFYTELSPSLNLHDQNYQVAITDIILEGKAGVIADIHSNSHKSLKTESNLYDLIADNRRINPLLKSNDNIYSESACYIYSNICKEQIVGDQNLKVLRIIPIKSSWIVFNQPHYVDVGLNYIQRILIDIRTNTGSRFPFPKGHCIIKLHFKSKNY